MTSDVPSRPTAMLSCTGVVFDTASASTCTCGSSRETMIGSRWNTCTTSVSASAFTAARISSGFWPGR